MVLLYPKKGRLTNWQTVTLHSVPGEVFSSILLGRIMMQLTANYDKNWLTLDVEDHATTKYLFRIIE